MTEDSPQPVTEETTTVHTRRVGPPAEEMIMTIGVKEIYDTGVATAAAVKEISKDLREAREAEQARRAEDRARIEDHETRLRALEKWRWAIGGAIGLGCSALGYAIQLKGGG